MLYKEMKLKDKLPEMSEDEQLALLASDGMLVKRPIVVTEDQCWLDLKRLSGKKSCNRNKEF